VAVRGEVGGNHEEDAATTDIRSLSGHAGAFNQITIKAAINASDVGDGISQASHR